MSDLLAKLSAPFSPASVSWRVGATNPDKSRGLALAYIDARDVQDRLDQVCGVFWQVKHHHAGGEKLACEIGIKVDDEWLWRGDGAGATDVEAEKGSFSDSFKRAAVRWGIGRYLYDIASPWVELEAKGKTHVIPEREMARLRAMLAPKGQANVETPARPTTSQLPPPTLSQIRNAIAHAIDIADSADRVDGIIRVHTNDLALIKEASAGTYNDLMSRAAHKKSSLGAIGVVARETEPSRPVA